MANSSIETSFQNLVNVIKDKTYPAASGAALEADIADIKIDITDLGISKIGMSQIGMANGVASLDSNGKIPASQLPNTGSDAYRYNIVTKSTGGSDASITIKKYLNEELVSSTDYPYQTFDHTHVIIDSLFDMIYAEDGQAKYTMTLLENSTDHNAGYSKRWGYDETVDFSETFVMSDEDISFIAPPFRADVSYAVGDRVTRNSSFYRCKTPHTCAWDIADFDKISVDELFDEVYDSLDDKANSADLATVATTGSYNDLEDAPNWTSVADTEPKTWGGISAFTGTKIWSDGTDIYYSDGANQYVLNKATSTWSQKTWNGLTNFSGTDLWVDPDGDVYYSYNNTQYKLDKETSTWNPQTWYTIDPGTASYVWNDGENVYYSNNNTQYVLNKATSTWSQKTWTGMTAFFGKYIWTDGTDIYYSNGSTQYVLDKSNSNWVSKTWNGLDNFDGDRVWFDGDDIYYSYASSNKHYMFDKTNNTWVTKAWSNNIDGPNMWNCDDKTYYSNGGGSGTQFEIVHKDLSELVGKPGGLATLGSDGKLLRDQTNYVSAGQKANTTLGAKATAEGYNTTASGENSHAEGTNTKATNTNAHAEGSGTTASSNSSHAEGVNTTASGSYAHAEGSGTTASNNQAHAEGYTTTASGSASHAEGYWAKAEGSQAHAEGYETKASHDNSHAEGYGTKTGRNIQHVMGQYNEGKATTVMEIGWGSSNYDRLNIFEIDTDGNLVVTGDITDGDGNTLADMLGISKVGMANGVASLDSNGKVPISQIPGSVDEIKEGYLNETDGKFYEESTYTTEIPAASDKIYVDLSTNLEYRWGGSAYVEISKSIALGRTSSTAFPGDAGKAIEDCMPSNASSSNKLLTANDISTWAKASTKPTYTASEVGAIATTEKGAANGVASLGNDGKVPSSQLPTISGNDLIIKHITGTTPTAINSAQKLADYPTGFDKENTIILGYTVKLPAHLGNYCTMSDKRLVVTLSSSDIRMKIDGDYSIFIGLTCEIVIARDN